MQHEVKTVKATSKKYKTKDGVKESISKRVDLGVDSIFTVGDEVAITFKTDFDSLGNDSANIVADRDATISDLNDSIAKFKRELKEKTDIITATSNEIKALKTNVVELESDISVKDETIDELTADVTAKDEKLTDSEKTIDSLKDKVDELTATVGELKPLLLTKDATITDLEKQIAIYDAVDVDKLKTKADELDKSKNVVIFQQKQITEYIQLVNYYKETATAYKNQNPISKFIGRDATADISLPVLSLIDLSGNPISNDDATPDSDAVDDSEKSTTKDNITYI